MNLDQNYDCQVQISGRVEQSGILKGPARFGKHMHHAIGNITPTMSIRRCLCLTSQDERLPELGFLVLIQVVIVIHVVHPEIDEHLRHFSYEAELCIREVVD